MLGVSDLQAEHYYQINNTQQDGKNLRQASGASGRSTG